MKCFRKYTELYEAIRRMTKSELTTLTGCQPMCNYLRYEILKTETLNSVEGLGGTYGTKSKTFSLKKNCLNLDIKVAKT